MCCEMCILVWDNPHTGWIFHYIKDWLEIGAFYLISALLRWYLKAYVLEMRQCSLVSLKSGGRFVHPLSRDETCGNMFSIAFITVVQCTSYYHSPSQIDSTVVKAFALQVDGLGFSSLSGYKVGCLGHSKYVWVGQYEPSCLKFPSSVLEDKL